MPPLTIAAASALALAASVTMPCTGRYVVGDASGLAPTAVTLASGQVTLEPLCDAAPARLRRRGQGWRLVAAWKRCGTRRAVRLRATLASDCTFLTGHVAARGLRRTRLTATASACGDGIVDSGNTLGGGGEGCDDGNTLGGDACEATCVPCDPASSAPTSTWHGIQLNVLTRYGCPACHAPGAINALDLRPAAAYANVVGVPAGSAPGLLLVAPGDEVASVVFLKLAKGRDVVRYHGVPGSGMPPGASLTAVELEAVGRWIRTGAPPTGIVAGTDTLLVPCRPR